MFGNVIYSDVLGMGSWHENVCKGKWVLKVANYQKLFNFVFGKFGNTSLTLKILI